MAEQISRILSTVTMDKDIANSLIKKAERIPPSTLQTLLLNIAQCSKSNHAAELRSDDPSWFRGKIILFSLANLICVYTFIIFSQKFNLAEFKFLRVALHCKSHS